MANCAASRASTVLVGAVLVCDFALAVVVLVCALAVLVLADPVVVAVVDEPVVVATFVAAFAGAGWVTARRTRNAAPKATITHNNVVPASRMRAILRCGEASRTKLRKHVHRMTRSWSNGAPCANQATADATHHRQGPADGR